MTLSNLCYHNKQLLTQKVISTFQINQTNNCIKKTIASISKVKDSKAFIDSEERGQKGRAIS